jgi:hypothetical protein
MDNSEVVARIEALYQRLTEEIKPGVADDLQCELALLINVLPDIKRVDSIPLLNAIEIAINTLLCEQPNLKLAQDIIEDVRTRVRIQRNPLRAILKGGTSPTRVILGLSMLLYIAVPLLLVVWPWLSNREQLFGIETGMLGVVVFGGALGSVVSIMVRIHDFAGLDNQDPSVLFLTGFFKPVIGVSFALFVYAMLEAGLIPVEIKAESERFFYAALSFISGFSERFARDVVTRAEAALSGGK